MRFKCLAWPALSSHIYFSPFETPIETCTLVPLRPKHVMRERLFRGCRWVQSTELDIVNELFSNLCTLALGMALHMFATQGWRVPIMHLAVNSSSAHSPRAKLRALEIFFEKKNRANVPGWRHISCPNAWGVEKREGKGPAPEIVAFQHLCSFSINQWINRSAVQWTTIHVSWFWLYFIFLYILFLTVC